MLADLKEAAEKRRQERSTVLQAVSGRADFSARLQVRVGGRSRAAPGLCWEAWALDTRLHSLLRAFSLAMPR